MRDRMLTMYNHLCELCDIKYEDSVLGVTSVLEEILKDFSENCENPAIWCYGEHTQKLMSDFAYELRKVKTIIDKKEEGLKKSGYKVISSDQIDDCQIDGVIISSYKYREDISSQIKSMYPKLKYLDIYNALEKKGICCKEEYYLVGHPYVKYSRLNELLHGPNQDAETLFNAVRLLVQIKDFRLARQYIQLFQKLYGEDKKTQEIEKQLDELYKLTVEAIGRIHSKNVLMLCIDSLRKEDLDNDLMPKIKKIISEKTCYFERAYSVSDSTYESLLPAYSENNDMRTGYYNSSTIPSNGCRFLNHAIKQGRQVFFYTDGFQYVDNDLINFKKNAQTVTEKIWDFILDGVDEKNGLFYIHVLYESHFSFVNPYTKEKLYANGTNMFFDLIDYNGGVFKADYKKQHEDALMYLDDTLSPYLDNMRMSWVLYADHGISIVPYNTSIDSISPIILSYADSKIRVPFAYSSGSTTASVVSDELFSLFEISDVLISLLDSREVLRTKKNYIKIQRSRIYNPDYIYLFEKLNFPKGILAFEGFIFSSGEKLIVYEDGNVDLFSAGDILKDDSNLKGLLLETVGLSVTVCDEELIWKSL